MKLVTQIAEVRQFCREASSPIIFVPTMGALHQGHLALIQHARKMAGSSGMVIVSIFVNPIQFAANEDLSRYPRTLAADAALCEEAGVDLLFHPAVEEMYAGDASIKIQEDQLSQGLCGASRPGHFSGMATVVAKLFNIVRPDIAIFGEKDWQQLAIIRRLVRDLNFPIEIIGHPIAREKDGLAMSSRNVYLSAEERSAAPQIYQTLQTTAAMVQSGESDVAKLLHSTRTTLAAIPKATIDYIEIVDSETLKPLSTLTNAPMETRLLVAVKLGSTRLIDNIKLY